MKSKYGRVTRQTIEELGRLLQARILSSQTEKSWRDILAMRCLLPNLISESRSKTRRQRNGSRITRLCQQEENPCDTNGGENGTKWWMHTYLWWYCAVTGANEPDY